MLQEKPLILDRLCEIVLNVLKGKVPLSSAQKRRWGRHRQGLRRLISPSINASQRIELIQSGGFLPFVVPLAVKLLSGLMQI